MDHYSNSQFDSFRWKEVHSEFSESWINEWAVALSASCPHSEGQADLRLTAPERAPWPPARQLWEGLGVGHFKVYSVPVQSENTAFVFPQPPASQFHPPLPLPHLLSGPQSSVALASCVAWHPSKSENPPYVQRCLCPPSPACWRKKTDVHYVAKSTFCTTSFCMRRRQFSLLAAFLSKHLCL